MPHWGLGRSILESVLPGEDITRTEHLRECASSIGRTQTPGHFFELPKNTGGAHKDRSSKSPNTLLGI